MQLQALGSCEQAGCSNVDRRLLRAILFVPVCILFCTGGSCMQPWTLPVGEAVMSHQSTDCSWGRHVIVQLCVDEGQTYVLGNTAVEKCCGVTAVTWHVPRALVGAAGCSACARILCISWCTMFAQLPVFENTPKILGPPNEKFRAGSCRCFLQPGRPLGDIKGVATAAVGSCANTVCPGVATMLFMLQLFACECAFSVHLWMIFVVQMCWACQLCASGLES